MPGIHQPGLAIGNIKLQKVWQLQLYCHVQPRAALELAYTLSRSPAVGSHYLALDRARSHSLAFARACHNFFCTRSSICWLALSRTRSLSVELARPVLQNHSVFTRFLHAIRFHLLRSYQILWKYFRWCRRCDRKTKLKGMFPSGWI